MAREASVAAVCASVALLLKKERLARKLSLTRLAAQASLSRQMVSYVERGMRVPTIDTLLRITRVLDLDAAKLITRAHRNAE